MIIFVPVGVKLLVSDPYMNGHISILHIFFLFQTAPNNLSCLTAIGAHVKCMLFIKQVMIGDVFCRDCLMQFMSINMFSLSLLLSLIKIYVYMIISFLLF